LQSKRHLRSVSRLLLAGLPLLFTFFACSKGVPALRHDWVWPSGQSGFLRTFLLSTSGWSPLGAGLPVTYLSGYIIAVPLTLAGLIFGGLGALLMYIFAVALLIAAGARRLCWTVDRHASQGIVVACVTFALFNPWVYCELVAGHTYMLIAYGGTLLLISEMLRSFPSKTFLAATAILTFAQLQFFLIVLVVLVVHALVKRQRLPVLTGLIIGGPTFLGILGNAHSITMTPFTLEWERQQSLDPAHALMMLGYFTKYDAAFEQFGIVPLALLVVVVMRGLGAVRERRNLLMLAIPCCAFLAFATGTKWIFGPVFTTLVTRVPAIGVFRELYDLVGLVAAGYLVFLILGARNSPVFALATVLSAAGLVLIWILSPPSQFWVNASSLPHVHIDAQPNERFALYPAFQPLTFRAKGSGTDPDAVLHPHDVMPLNEQIPSYPVDKALATYERVGDDALLKGLGVTRIYERPWYRTDSALNSQIASKFRRHPGNARGSGATKRLSAIPLLTQTEMPLVGELNANIGAGNVFFGDARSVSGAAVPRYWRSLPEVRRLNVSNVGLNDASGWIDARFVFMVRPELAQAFGGAYTRSSEPLTIPQSRGALVYVNGSLFDGEGKVVTRSTFEYRWVKLRSSNMLHCVGECVVALLGETPKLPLQPTPRLWSVVPYKVLAPWLFVAVRTTQAPILRLNVRFAPTWLAISQGHLLAHLRLDAAVNAWFLPRGNGDRRVVIINEIAALQALAEVVGFAWTVIVLTRVRWRIVPLGKNSE